MNGRRRTILAIDGSEANLVILEELLGDRYDLQCCQSGEDGLELMASDAPDLVLLDVVMPGGLDGYETCRRIRESPAIHHTMVILVAARARTAERLKGYEAGADYVLAKPLDSDELLAKIEVFLRLKLAEEVAELQTHIIAAMQHEIDNPLARLLAKSSRRTATEGLRMSELAQRGLTGCHLKNGLIPLAENEFNLAAEVVAAAGAVTGVFVVCRIPTNEPCNVFADSHLLRAAIQSMIDGAVTLSKSTRGIHLEIGLQSTHECRVVALRVSGAQFEPHDIERLLSASTAHRQSAPNINLLLAREVFLAHGGELAAKLDEGGELLLTGTIPVAVPLVIPIEI
jgi:DNA-binding response OmpR family regulator